MPLNFIFMNKLSAYWTMEQLEFMKQRIWWCACQQTPYLLKLGIYNETLFLQCTDMQSMYALSLCKQELEKDKQIFAKTLDVASHSDLLALFEQLLSNSDWMAQYKFKKTNDNKLIFNFGRKIQFYPFKWKFILQEVQHPIVQTICKEIINPLTLIIETQRRYNQSLQNRLTNIQKLYQAKANEHEKKLFKSTVKQQPISTFIPEVEDRLMLPDQKVRDIQIKIMAKKAKEVKHEQLEDHPIKRVALPKRPEEEQQAHQQIINSQPQTKKKKKLDFL